MLWDPVIILNLYKQTNTKYPITVYMYLIAKLAKIKKRLIRFIIKIFAQRKVEIKHFSITFNHLAATEKYNLENYCTVDLFSRLYFKIME